MPSIARSRAPGPGPPTRRAAAAPRPQRRSPCGPSADPPYGSRSTRGPVTSPPVAGWRLPPRQHVSGRLVAEQPDAALRRAADHRLDVLGLPARAVVGGDPAV